MFLPLGPVALEKSCSRRPTHIAYITDEIIRKNITMLMALAFVPTGDVADAFMQIAEDEIFFRRIFNQ